MNRLQFLLATIVTLLACADAPVQAQSQWVFVGTYTDGRSAGIYSLKLDLATGTLTPVATTSGIENPSFLAIHPAGKFLYAVSELAELNGERSGGVSSYSLDNATGKLAHLNSQLSRGAAPCHLVVDKTGKTVLVANYSGGNVVALPIQPDGSLGPVSSNQQHQGAGVNPVRQEGPHAHSINLDATNTFAIAADLGLDKLLVYRLNPDQSTLTPNDPPFAQVAAGGGPRHFAFHPNGQFAYTNNEMTSTVTVLKWNPEKGVLTPGQTLSTLPGDFAQDKNSTAEVQVHPAGRLLYVSNRGHDSVAIFGIDPQTGELSPLGHHSTGGKTPRGFGIDPTGTYLLAANQSSDSIIVFRIDPTNGKLSQIGQPVEIPRPVCVKFLPIP